MYGAVMVDLYTRGGEYPAQCASEDFIEVRFLHVFAKSVSKNFHVSVGLPRR